MEILACIFGCLVMNFYNRYQVIKLLKQLDKVCNTGDEMWGNGVRYSMDQIRKML